MILAFWTRDLFFYSNLLLAICESLFDQIELWLNTLSRLLGELPSVDHMVEIASVLKMPFAHKRKPFQLQSLSNLSFWHKNYMKEPTIPFLSNIQCDIKAHNLCLSFNKTNRQWERIIWIASNLWSSFLSKSNLNLRLFSMSVSILRAWYICK